MILKIDHIALSSNNFEKDIVFFETLGFNVFFKESDVKNLEIKKDLLTQFYPNHDLCLLTKKGSYNIELLNHRNINDKDGFIYPVFQNIPNNKRWHSEGEIEELKVKIKIGPGYKFLDKENKVSNDFLFNELVVNSINLEQSINFWKSLGFELIEQSETLAKMKFVSLLDHNNYFIYLKKANTIGNNLLDDRGFNSVAFICKSIDRVIRKIKNEKIIITKQQDLTINHKNLKICFIKGPQNELVELVELEY